MAHFCHFFDDVNIDQSQRKKRGKKMSFHIHPSFLFAFSEGDPLSGINLKKRALGLYRSSSIIEYTGKSAP